MTTEILIGDCIESMKSLPSGSISACITSPPYFGLRRYLPEDHPDSDKEVGLEQTPDEFVQKMVVVFREVKRVLRDDGVCFCNLGDSYVANKTGGLSTNASLMTGGRKTQEAGGNRPNKKPTNGLKNKDLIGIPWRVAFALQADGWYLRQDIVWCLSGGTWVYAKTQKSEMPTTIKDLYRLDPKTVKLWNGEKWTQTLGISKSARTGDEIELVLRSGERISCTKTHRFPTNRGLLPAGNIQVGDKLQSCKLPEPCEPKDCALDEDAAWFAGLYLAEGSMSGSAIQIAGHSKESKRWETVQRIAQKYGGTATRTVSGNNMNIRVYGGFLHTIVKEFVGGRTAIDKHLSCSVWKYSNSFLAAMIDGYLSGDGHKSGGRWRLGFCRNYNLERDLRTACSRLGYSLTLNMSKVAYNGGFNQAFRGEIRKTISTHWNNKDRAEVVEIRKARARQFYDIGVEDEPHLFSLASGILTHNSKPNPMPESVTDRCTKSHEYVFLLTKSARYWYDAEAIREGCKWDGQSGTKNYRTGVSSGRVDAGMNSGGPATTRNRRSVWTVSTQSYAGCHFATFPPKLIEPMILAGCPAKCCPVCGAGWVRVVEKVAGENQSWAQDTNPTEKEKALINSGKRAGHGKLNRGSKEDYYNNCSKSKTLGFQPSCQCNAPDHVPGTVLDPFGGSGTTAYVANAYGRNAILCELNPEYEPLIRERLGMPYEVEQEERKPQQQEMF